MSLRVFAVSLALFSVTACADSCAKKAPARPAAVIKLDPRSSMKKEPPPVPPSGLFERVKYPAAPGELWAYVTPAPKDGKKKPAIVWALGGFSNGIGAAAFQAGPPINDPSASALREAGLVLMLPSYRGGNDNPGQYEELYGEVEDFLAAVEFTKKLPYVDPDRVYIGGQSTGGTLVLLAAGLSQDFRAAFAIGPIHEARAYGENHAPFDREDEEAWNARSPLLALPNIRRPVFVIEGELGNAASAHLLAERSAAAFAPVKTLIMPRADHFETLQPAAKLIAKKILADTGDEVNIVLNEDDLRSSN